MMALVNIRNLVILAWAVANASLVLLIGGELGWGKKLVQSMPVAVVHPSAPIEIVLPPDYRLPALEKAYVGTLERSLFVPTRRKAPPPPPPPPPSMQKGQFQLLGTTITDEFNIAIVKEISSGKVRQIYQGYTINGLQLDLVEPNRIVFSQYDDREEVRLKIQASPKPVAAPQGAPQSEQPVKTQAVPAPSQRPKLPAEWAKGQDASARQADRPVAVPTTPQAVPLTPQAVPLTPQAREAGPQTMEDRKSNPMLKDFYK